MADGLMYKRVHVIMPIVQYIEIIINEVEGKH